MKGKNGSYANDITNDSKNEKSEIIIIFKSKWRVDEGYQYMLVFKTYKTSECNGHFIDLAGQITCLFLHH